MNHNKHNLVKNQAVWLDADYRNKSIVVTVSFTPSQLYTTVYAFGDDKKKTWEVMTNRLTPLFND